MKNNLQNKRTRWLFQSFTQIICWTIVVSCCYFLKNVSLQFDLTTAVSVANVEIKNKIQVFGLLEKAEDAVNS